MVKINETPGELGGDDIGPVGAAVRGFPDGRAAGLHEYEKAGVRIPPADRDAPRSARDRDGVKGPGIAAIDGFSGKWTRKSVFIDGSDPDVIGICDGVIIGPVPGLRIVQWLRHKLTHAGPCHRKKQACKDQMFHDFFVGWIDETCSGSYVVNISF